MSLYYFYLRDGVDITLDEEGRQIEGPAEIADAALMEARAIISDDARSGRICLDQRIDVEDEFRNVVHSLEFTEAIEIVHPNVS